MRRIASQPPELPGYTHVKLLGSGGFSDVFLYQQALPKRLVAVKVMLTDKLTDANRDAFVAEANVMAQLSAHPYIVSIFDAGVSADDRPYLVMEYLAGPSLAERYKRAPLEVPDAVRIGIRLASAVATAHASGILHRDIKPGNVLTNDYGWPALTDFGIAAAIDDDVLPVHTTTTSRLRRDDPADTGSGSGSGELVGLSIPWSPPEMFADDPRPDRRSDVFSLAATVFTLLAGRTPFEVPGRANGSLDLIGRIEAGRVLPLPDSVPRSLQAVLAAGLAVDPDARTASAIEFARALQRVELELGFERTSIEVPNLLVQAVQEAVEEEQAAEQTRARGVATIQAQPPRAVPPTTRPAIGAPPPADTVVRAPSAASGTVVPGAQTPTEPDTVLRPRPIEAQPADGADTIARPRPVHAQPAAGSDAPEEQLGGPARPRRRGLVVGLAVVGVLAVAGIVVSVVLAGGALRQGADPDASGNAQGDDGGGSAIVPTVPAVENLVGSPNPDGTATFTWSEPSAQEGDSFQWWRSEDPNDPKSADTASATVPTQGSRVCITVVVVRAGKTGAETQGCYPA